jgi:hypothetical protein
MYRTSRKKIGQNRRKWYVGIGVRWAGCQDQAQINSQYGYQTL